MLDDQVMRFEQKAFHYQMRTLIMSNVSAGFHVLLTGKITTLLIILTLLAICSSGAIAAESWQPAKTGSWIIAEIPPEWSIISETVNESSGSGLVSAQSPDMNSRLTYILEQNQKSMTNNEIQQYQSRYMSRLGFRICMTKDPVISDTPELSSYRQTYVRGSTDAAVMGTLQFPGKGAHYVLVMEGSSAVAQYYETIPPALTDHIRPVPGE